METLLYYIPYKECHTFVVDYSLLNEEKGVITMSRSLFLIK